MPLSTNHAPGPFGAKSAKLGMLILYQATERNYGGKV